MTKKNEDRLSALAVFWQDMKLPLFFLAMLGAVFVGGIIVEETAPGTIVCTGTQGRYVCSATWLGLLFGIGVAFGVSLHRMVRPRKRPPKK